MAYIFMLELIVEDLELFSEEGEGGARRSSEGRTGELCVRVELKGLARLEVCEKDFGSALALESGPKTGENCLFVYDPSLALNGAGFTVEAYEKCGEGRGKKLLGSCPGVHGEMLQNLARSYEGQRGSKVPSSESIRSNGRAQREPVSQTLKEMYSLRAVGDEATVIGYAVLTLRLSCLGSSINQKVLLAEQNDRSVACLKQNDELIVKCVNLGQDELQDQLVGPQTSLATVTPVSEEPEQPPYDEYAAQLNGNSICIRIEKDANIAICLDGEQESTGCTKGCWTSLTLPEGVYGLKEEYVQQQANGCNLPVVRGTLKYPAYHWSGDFMLGKQRTPVTIEDFRRKPDPTRTVGLQTGSEGRQDVKPNLGGIQFIHKTPDDPAFDVFTFKFGKNKRSPNGRNQIEIELRTPKAPWREPCPKVTRGAQVLEDEFEPVAVDGKNPTLKPPEPSPARPSAGGGGGDGKAKGKGKPKAAATTAVKKGKKK
ncbi:uncharacterized protein LOC131216176 [Anopheles bellator]|uniref:uncharacterized protein LOC131216176 n=1 Tax=Anopheles bellator TaxID=139047 RepID=UPI0026486CAE|nr:uncharacterized protein LOC131216176 [Anopheles bellator]